jgi:archaellum biogenesis protein FlaJ (TadC family)
MSKTSEKYEDILQYELDALKEIRKNWFERAEEHTRYSDLVRGTALGLTLGIAGNLFVQFLYPVTEALFLGEYKPTFVGNLIICAISLILIVFVSINLRRQLKQYENKLKSSRESVEVIEYAIKRRQLSLEQRKKNNNQVYEDDKIQEESNTLGGSAS